MTDLRKTFSEFERDYTTKEEWLRECLHARRVVEQLTETTVRIETTLGNILPRANAMFPSSPGQAVARSRTPGAVDGRGDRDQDPR